jgi:phosphatidylserine synthase
MLCLKLTKGSLVVYSILMLEINYSQESSIVFALIFLALVLLSIIRKPKTKELFPLTDSEELKGFAIFAIIFAHVGYSLVVDTTFSNHFLILLAPQ